MFDEHTFRVQRKGVQSLVRGGQIEAEIPDRCCSHLANSCIQATKIQRPQFVEKAKDRALCKVRQQPDAQFYSGGRHVRVRSEFRHCDRPLSERKSNRSL